MVLSSNDKFEILTVERKFSDTCEQCDSKKRPVYYLKSKYDNLDTMLCQDCLRKLKEVLNNVS